MPEYLVSWVIDIEADTPEEAAQQALETQRNPESIAVYFTVIDRATNDTTNVDLLEVVTDD